MSRSQKTPIARTLFALLREGKDGALVLREPDAHALADALLAHSDADLRAAVWELVHVAKIASEQLHNDRIADRILDIAEIAIDRLKKSGVVEGAELEGLKHAIRERPGSESVPKTARDAP